MTMRTSQRRSVLKFGGAGLAAAGLAASVLDAKRAAAAPGSLLQKVLNRGHVIVGTGSSNAPWHFKDDKGVLTGMDIAMAKILALALFDDEKKVEYVLSTPASRIPNITTGKVDIVIDFMTVTPQRAQLVAFTVPYYVEAVSLLTLATAKVKTFDQLAAMGSDARVSILQNVTATEMVHRALPKAQVLQLDTQGNVIQALDSHRVDGAAVDLSNTRWLVKQQPNRYFDSGKTWDAQLYSAAVRLDDPEWLHFVNTTFQVAMFSDMGAHELYVSSFDEFFGERPPSPRAGFPSI